MNFTTFEAYYNGLCIPYSSSFCVGLRIKELVCTYGLIPYAHSSNDTISVEEWKKSVSDDRADNVKRARRIGAHVITSNVSHEEVNFHGTLRRKGCKSALFEIGSLAGSPSIEKKMRSFLSRLGFGLQHHN